MTTSVLTPTQSAFFNLNRKGLIYIIIFLAFIPSTINLLTGRLGQGATDSSGSIWTQSIDLLIFVNSIILMRVFGISSRFIFSCLLPLACMLAWILLSVTWSEYPWLTTRRGFRLIIELISIVILAACSANRAELLRIMFRAFFVINLLDLISIAVPTISFSPLGFEGVHGNKNLAGAFFFLALPIFFIGIIDRSVSRSLVASVFGLLSASGMLAFSGAKTAIGATIIAILFVIASRWAMPKYYRLVNLLMYGLFASAIVLVVYDIGMSEILNYLFADPTLTGRDLIWRYAFHAFEGKPWTGVGYGALWDVGTGEAAAQTNAGIIWGIMNEAHNGYIDILAQLGILGILFLVFFIAGNFVRIYRYASSFESDKIFGLGDYAIYNIWGGLVYNITDSYFFTPHPQWFVLVFISTAAAGHVLRTQLNEPVFRYTRM